MSELIELLIEFCSLIIGVYCLNRLNDFFKVIVLQIIIAFGVEFIGRILFSLNIRNVWLFNLYEIVEAGLLLFAAKKIVNFDNRFLYLLLIPIFFWFYSVFKNGFNYFTSVAYVSFSIAILIVYLNLLFKSVLTYRGDLVKLPTLWLAIGVILFFGCNIPYLSMLNYLCNNFNQEVNNTLHLILKTFCNLRYILMAISLIMTSRQNQILSGR